MSVPWSWKWPLLTLLLAAPAAGVAAEPPAPETESSHPPDVPESLQPAAPLEEPEPVHPVSRIWTEVGFVAASAGPLGLTGMIIGYAVADPRDDANSFIYFPDTAHYGLVTGIVLGAPFAAWGAGTLRGGRGTLPGTLIGTGMAAGAGAVTSLLVTNDDMKPFCIPVFSMVGAIVGYEVSHALNTTAPQAATSVSLQPLLAVSGKHTALGLSGSF